MPARRRIAELLVVFLVLLHASMAEEPLSWRGKAVTISQFLPKTTQMPRQTGLCRGALRSLANFLFLDFRWLDDFGA